MFWWERQHKHSYAEHVGGKDADGCATEIWWECSCGAMKDRDAMVRADATEKLYAAMKQRADT